MNNLAKAIDNKDYPAIVSLIPNEAVKALSPKVKADVPANVMDHTEAAPAQATPVQNNTNHIPNQIPNVRENAPIVNNAGQSPAEQEAPVEAPVEVPVVNDIPSPNGKVASTIHTNMPINQAEQTKEAPQATQETPAPQHADVTPLPTPETQQNEGVRPAPVQQPSTDEQYDARIAEIKKIPLEQRKETGRKMLEALRQNNAKFDEKKLAEPLMNGVPGAIDHVQRAYGDILNTITPAEAAAAPQHNTPNTAQVVPKMSQNVNLPNVNQERTNTYENTQSENQHNQNEGTENQNQHAEPEQSKAADAQREAEEGEVNSGKAQEQYEEQPGLKEQLAKEKAGRKRAERVLADPAWADIEKELTPEGVKKLRNVVDISASRGSDTLLTTISPLAAQDFRVKPSDFRETGKRINGIEDKVNRLMAAHTLSDHTKEAADNGEQAASIEANIEHGKKAMQHVIDTHEDVRNAMYRDGIGNIDFLYGTPGKGAKFKHGYGISHIVAKRNAENNDGAETALKLVSVIARGTDIEKQGAANDSGNYRLRIHYKGYTAVLTPEENNRNAWLLTGWEDNEKEAPVNARGEVHDSSAATTTAPTRTRRDGETDASSTSSVAQGQENSKAKVPPMGKPIAGRSGKETTVVTDSGKEIRVRYLLVPMGRIITSHNAETMAQNKVYPQELQPRDRQRATMREQVRKMANNLRPEELGAGRNLNQGAPVIRKDGVVLNGNGRAMAIQLAHAMKNASATAYNKYISEHAPDFGISNLDAWDHPRPYRNAMLVREVVDDIDADTMQDIIDSTVGGSRMGASEQAKADAKKIKAGDLDRYVENDQGDLTTAANRDFVSAVLYRIAGENERNAYTDKDGNVNADGIQRVKRAIFSLAYGDDDLISKMAESTDDNIRNVSNGLMNAAPLMAKVSIGMRDGTLHQYDVGKTISEAVKRLSALREEGKPVDVYLNEQSMFSDYQDTDEMRDVLRFFDKNKRSGKKISAYLRHIADGIMNQGSPDEMTLGGEKPLTLGEIINNAEHLTLEGETGADLFADVKEPDTHYSAEEQLATDSRAWKETLREAWKGNMPDSTMLPVMQTPTVLQLIGAPDYPIVMRQSKLMKIKKDHPEMTKAILKQLPSYLADPMIIFKSSTVPGRFVVGLELKDTTGINVVVPLELNAKSGRIDVNVLTSAYGRGDKNHTQIQYSWFLDNIVDGNAVYVNKKQAADFYQSAGLQLPMEGRRFNDLFGSSIKTDADLVKAKNENPEHYFADEQQKEQARGLSDIKQEVAEAFPNAQNIQDDGRSISFTMPNGAKVRVNIVPSIEVGRAEAAEARNTHGINANAQVIINGRERTVGQNALIELSQLGKRGTSYHEAFHAIYDMCLTNQEKSVLHRAYDKEAKGLDKDVYEVMADAYRDWMIARQKGHGTRFGKLWRKIKDTVSSILHILRKADSISDVFRRMESGEVWERPLNSKSSSNRYLVTNEQVLPRHRGSSH